MKKHCQKLFWIKRKIIERVQEIVSIFLSAAMFQNIDKNIHKEMLLCHF